MPINKNNFVIFDFETDDLPVHRLNPLQLSALVVEPVGLNIVEDSEFNSWILPDELVKEGDDKYYDNHRSTLDWHCRNKRCSIKEFLTQLRNSPTEKVVWGNFIEYLKKYNTGGGMWGNVVATGENIINFDLKIIDKCARKYNNVNKNGEQNIFHPRDIVDMKNIYFLLFNNLPEPQSYSADVIYDWLGLTTIGRHDSLVDVRGCAEVFIRFQKYFRRHTAKTKFKGSFLKDNAY